MTESPMVVFLTEAGAGVGLGHLRRCQALAAALGPDGVATRVVVAVDTARNRGRTIPTEVSLDWLQDPARMLGVLADWRPEAVVLDTYAATTEVVVTFAATAPTLAVIDDLADRRLPVSLVVNGGYAARDLQYRVAPDTTLLLGAEYALLAPEFRRDPPPRAGAVVTRILVALGGAASAGLLEAAIADVREVVPPGALIDVVVGPYADGRLEGDGRVTVHREPASLRALMLTADVAVVGGGVTLLECLASATPAVALCLSENQRPSVEGLSRDGVILRGDTGLGASLERLVGDATLRRTLAVRGRRIVDGRGAERVARVLLRAPVAAPPTRAPR